MIRQVLWAASVPNKYPKHFTAIVVLAAIALAVVDIVSDWLLTKRQAMCTFQYAVRVYPGHRYYWLLMQKGQRTSKISLWLLWSLTLLLFSYILCIKLFNMILLKLKRSIMTRRSIKNEVDTLRLPSGTLLLLQTNQTAKWLVLTCAIVSSIIGIASISFFIWFLKVSVYEHRER